MKKALLIGLIIFNNQAYCAQLLANSSLKTQIFESLKNGASYLIDTVEAYPYITALITITGWAAYRINKNMKKIVCIYKNPSRSGFSSMPFCKPSKVDEIFLTAMNNNPTLTSAEWIVWHPSTKECLIGNKAEELIKLINPSCMKKSNYFIEDTCFVPALTLKEVSLHNLADVLRAIKS